MARMSIADMLKYAEFLGKRQEDISKKVKQIEVVKTTTRLVATGVEEITSPTFNIEEVMSEYDKNAKELRLVRSEIEKYNHTTVIEFNALY